MEDTGFRPGTFTLFLRCPEGVFHADITLVFETAEAATASGAEILMVQTMYLV